MKYHLFAALLILFSGLLHAAIMPRSAPVPGGIAVVPLTADTGRRAPHVYFDGQRVMVLKRASRWTAVVGIPLDSRPGAASLKIQTDGGQKSSQEFTIHDKQYATQRISIKDKRKVNPSAQDLKRIRREHRLMQSVFTAWRSQDEVPMQFDLPVQGPISSPFGLRRIFNGQPRKPHSGIDIAVSAGTPIHAPAAGRVAAVDNYFFDGNTVLVDHGQGLVTMHCHMQKTGRATGPHVHWGVSLNNTRIDPALFLPPDALAKLEEK